MRLVSWNCRGTLSARKFAALSELQYDIAVIPEARLKNLALHNIPSDRGCWVGQEGTHGLAVVTSAPWTVESLPSMSDEELFMPVICRHPDAEVQVLAVCTKPRKPHRNYVGPTTRALAAYDPWLRSSSSIIAGDLNGSVSWKPEGAGFAKLLESLLSSGFTSAWHRYTGEEYGKESTSTVFLQNAWKSNYHIDYVFLPSPQTWHPKSVSIGSFQDWVASSLSDHLPIIVDVDLPAR